MLVLCIAKCIARAHVKLHVDQHVDWLLDVMHIYMRVCSCFTAMLTVSDSDVSFLGAGCWVLVVLNTLIEHRLIHTRGVVVYSIQ